MADANDEGRVEELAEDALIDAAQFIDAIRQDALQEGWWTNWDQEMRNKITRALEAIVAQRGSLTRR